MSFNAKELHFPFSWLRNQFYVESSKYSTNFCPYVILAERRQETMPDQNFPSRYDSQFDAIEIFRRDSREEDSKNNDFARSEVARAECIIGDTITPILAGRIVCSRPLRFVIIPRNLEERGGFLHIAMKEGYAPVRTASDKLEKTEQVRGYTDRT